MSHDDPNDDDSSHVTHAIDDNAGTFFLFFFNTKFFKK